MITKRLIHLYQLISYKLLSESRLNKSTLDINCDKKRDSVIKVYTYNLPYYYTKNDHFDLKVTYQTFEAISQYFSNCIETTDPTQADYFFVPLHLHRFQYKNLDPYELLDQLTYLSDKKDHIIVATGDFAQRGKHYGHGSAYLKEFSWLKKFILLALESTPALIKNQDIGIIPYNTLSATPHFNDNYRPYLYSFFGSSYKDYLPETHVRRQLFKLGNKPDTYISDLLPIALKNHLLANYQTDNDYELVSRNSIFTLVPAGYGFWTYRFFQAVQWGSIPIILSDNYVKPFSDQIPYDKFCVTVSESEVSNLDKIIRSISKKSIGKLQSELKMAQSLFTPDNFFAMLTKQLVIQRKYLP